MEAEPIAAAEIHAEPMLAEPIEVEARYTEEMEHEPMQELVGSGHADEPIPVAQHQDELELIPVPRSVFDDDFFRASARELLSTPAAPVIESRMPSARGFDSPDAPRPEAPRPVRVLHEEAPAAEARVPEPRVSEPVVRVPVFAGYAPREPAEADELDIPAFLRRGH
jgi:cell division protein FtsZ